MAIAVRNKREKPVIAGVCGDCCTFSKQAGKQPASGLRKPQGERGGVRKRKSTSTTKEKNEYIELRNVRTRNNSLQETQGSQ